MECRVEAARHGDEIAVDLRLAHDPPTSGPIGRDPDAGDGEPAEACFDADNRRTERNRDAGRLRLSDESAFRLRPRIDDAGNPDAGFTERQRSRIGIVIVGEDDAGDPGCYAVALDECTRRGAQHDPRPVIVGEGDRPFDCPGREDDLSRPDLPQAVARHALVEKLRIMVGHALAQHEIIVMPVANRGGAGEHMYIRRLGKAGGYCRDPGELAFAVDGRAAEVRQSAKPGMLIADNDPRSRCARRFCRGEAGDARADHQHVAMNMDMLVGIGITALGR
jgi:hypothetical protein